MSTFGYTTQGTAGVQLIWNTIVGSRFTISENGTADSITAYLDQSAAGSFSVKCAIYRYSDLVKICESAERTDINADGWYTFTISGSPSLSSGTEYIIVVWSSSNRVRIAYDAGTTAQGQHDSATYGTWPDPLVPSATNDRNYSIYCTYTSSTALLSESKRITYIVKSSSTKELRITYFIGTIINKSVRVTYHVIAKYKKHLVIPYNQYRDHNLMVRAYGTSWGIPESEIEYTVPVFNINFASSRDYGIGCYQYIFSANQRIGDNRCIRYGFHIDTAFYSEKFFLQAGYDTARPKDHLRFRIYDKTYSQIAGGVFRHSSIINKTSASGAGLNRYWLSTDLPYAFSTGKYYIVLYASTMGVSNRYYNANILGYNSPNTLSFQGSTATYSYSTDSGKSWAASSNTYELPFMFAMKSIVGSVMAQDNTPFGGARVYIKTTSYPTYQKYVITDHSGWYEMPLKRETVQNVRVEKYDFLFKTNNIGSLDVYNTSNFNYHIQMHTIPYVTKWTPYPNQNHYFATADTYWWSHGVAGTNTAPGMSYAFRDKILLGNSHLAISSSKPIIITTKTGDIIKSPAYNAHPTFAINTWANNVMYHNNHTHVIYLTNDWNVGIVSYDHLNNIWYNTSRVVTAAATDDDTHHAPSAVIDGSGRIHVFYGCHHGLIHYMMSSSIGNGSVWLPGYNIDGKGAPYMTYPRGHFNSRGELFVFARGFDDSNLSTSLWCVLRKDTSHWNISAWHSALSIQMYKESHSALTPAQAAKALYCVGTGIDVSDNLHCALIWATDYGNSNGYTNQGVTYCYSSSNGYRWRDMMLDVPWKAGGYGQGTNIPSILSYNTVRAVRFSSCTMGAKMWGGNFDAMTFSEESATASSVRRPFFMVGYHGSNNPISDRINYLLIKWMGDVATSSGSRHNSWKAIDVTSAFGIKVYDGQFYGGGLVNAEGQLYTYYSYYNDSARSWGGAPGVVECKTVDKGTSWSFNILTNHYDVGQAQTGLKKNYSNRQLEGVLAIDNTFYYLNNIKRYPYMRPDGEDVRIVWRGEEIDRVADIWNYASTKVYFKLQLPIGANVSSATSGYYYLYYGREQWT